MLYSGRLCLHVKGPFGSWSANHFKHVFDKIGTQKHMHTPHTALWRAHCTPTLHTHDVLWAAHSDWMYMVFRVPHLYINIDAKYIT